MSLSGGGDRRELRPLRRDGNVDHDLAGHTVVGNHKGQHSGFNILDPRPGTVHQFGTRRDILSARQRGWWIADPEVDGKPAYEIMQDYVSERAHPVDQSGGLYPEYVHLVTSIENYRALQEEHQQRNREQQGTAEMGYFGSVSEDEFSASRSRDGRRHLPTRFATKDHGTYVREGGRTVEFIAPQGILREEDL